MCLCSASRAFRIELQLLIKAGSLRQTRHPFELQHQPQRGHCIIDVAAAGSMLQPIGDMTPSVLLAAFGRQIAEQGANVAKCSQRRDGREL